MQYYLSVHFRLTFHENLYIYCIMNSFKIRPSHVLYLLILLQPNDWLGPVKYNFKCWAYIGVLKCMGCCFMFGGA